LKSEIGCSFRKLKTLMWILTEVGKLIQRILKCQPKRVYVIIY
jgi:hypothetical protein